MGYRNMLIEDNQVFVDVYGTQYSKEEMEEVYPDVLEQYKELGYMRAFKTLEEYEA